MPSIASFAYDVFLSYSSKDKELAEKLSRRIRRYTPPKRTGISKKKLTVFRDVERLTASASLGDALKEKIGNSAFLVLICSPASAASNWVNEETRLFSESNGKQNIIYCLHEGDFKSSLPPFLASSPEEPLYIDLTDKKRRNFRTQSLKLIAALHRVDFMTLLREDEVRRKRITRTLAASALLFITLLLSIYFILSVPSSYWQMVEQPEEYGPNRVMPVLPVHDIAIHKNDPEEILYLFKNAEWPDDPKIYTVLPDEKEEELDSLTAAAVKKSGAIVPLADISFELTNDNNNFNGKGLIRLWGAVDDSGRARYLRMISYRGADTANKIREVSMPAAVVPAEENPLDIGTLIQRLIQEGLADNTCSVTAVLSNSITKKKYPLQYSLDSDELLSDGYFSRDDYYGAEYYILKGGGKDNMVSGYDLLQAKYRRSFWDTVQASTDYLSYQAPVIQRVYSMGSETRPEQELVKELCTELHAYTDTASLTNALIAMGIEWTEDLIYFNLLTTRSLQGTTTLLNISAEQLNRHDASTPTFTRWIMRPSRSSPWREVVFPSDNIVGLWPLLPDANHSLLLTGDKGYFLTADAGKTWSPANYNETGFNNGIYVKTFVIDRNNIYSLIDRGAEASDSPNPLFRLRKRNWWQRWRQGLIELLK